MKTYTTLQNRGINAAKKFLEHKGFELIDEDPLQDAIDLVARFDNILSIITVATRDASETGFPEENLARHSLEIAATQWLAEHEARIPSDIRVRFDSVSILVLSEPRAFLRLHTNVLGAD